MACFAAIGLDRRFGYDLARGPGGDRLARLPGRYPRFGRYPRGAPTKRLSRTPPRLPIPRFTSSTGFSA